MKPQFDRATKEWLKRHPLQQTTITVCSKCGLYYKPLLGHTCPRKGATAK